MSDLHVIRSVAKHLNCPICLGLFVDAATLICGHNFCLNCIQSHLKRNQEKCCPVCRCPHPHSLSKNNDLSNIVDLQDAGGRRIWDEVGTDPDISQEALRRRLEFLKQEIEKIKSKLNTEDKNSFGFVREDTTSSSPAGGSEAELSLLNSALKPEDRLNKPETKKSEIICTSGLNDNSDFSLDFDAAGLCTEFVSLTFSPQLGNRRLVFLDERRRMEVRSGPSLRTKLQHFEKSQWMADQEFGTGRHYWEVETRRCSGWAVGVGYGSLKPDEQLGRSAASWCIEWSSDRLRAWHHNAETPLKNHRPNRVRVLLDIDAGLLSFWCTTPEPAELHSIQVRFREPVRPVFWLFGTKHGNSLEFPEPRVERQL